MISRIELHNFATHEDLEIEFGTGKNVIIGPTGSGKTNLLQAIDFAFLGDVQGANLTELIADGSESTEVLLDYVDPRTSQTYRLHRTLSRDADGRVNHVCSITNLETNEHIRRPEPVHKTLEALGVDTSVFRYVVHVPQGRFADILQETQDRRTALDRLFEISQLENAYHELGAGEGPIKKIEDRKQEELLERARLHEKASRLSQEAMLYLNLTRGRQEKQQKLDETKKELKHIKEIAPSVEQRLIQFDGLEARINETKAMTQTCKITIESMLPQLREVLPEEEFAIIQSSDIHRTREYSIKLESDLPALTAERDAFDAEHTESVKKAAATKSQYDSALEQRSATEKQLEAISKYLDGKGEQPRIRCDKCGSILTPEQWIKHIDQTRTGLCDLEGEIKGLKEQWSNETLTAETLHRKLSEAKTKVENLERTIMIIKQLVTQREQLETAKTTEGQALIEVKKVIGELRVLLLEYEQSDEQVIQNSRGIHSRLESLHQQLEDSERELKSYEENMLGPQLRRVEEAKQADKQEKELQPQIDLDTKKIETLQAVRTAFREIQPAVRKSFVARITTSANDYLMRLYGGAEIESFEFTEDYEFFVSRAGHKRHANRLSGGQQVLASMAFMMALSEVLSQLDFLILDEPTTHLDEDRRKELVNVLENLRRVPQLIIVDHHAELLAAADTRFQVSLTGDGQSHVAQLSE